MHCWARVSSLCSCSGWRWVLPQCLMPSLLLSWSTSSPGRAALVLGNLRELRAVDRHVVRDGLKKVWGAKQEHRDCWATQRQRCGAGLEWKRLLASSC